MLRFLLSTTICAAILAAGWVSDVQSAGFAAAGSVPRSSPAFAVRVGEWVCVVPERDFSSITLTSADSSDFIQSEGVYWGKTPNNEIEFFGVECDGERCLITECTIIVAPDPLVDYKGGPPVGVNAPSVLKHLLWAAGFFLLVACFMFIFRPTFYDEDQHG